MVAPGEWPRLCWDCGVGLGTHSRRHRGPWLLPLHRWRAGCTSWRLVAGRNLRYEPAFRKIHILKLLEWRRYESLTAQSIYQP
jgi:hypothetical protein